MIRHINKILFLLSALFAALIFMMLSSLMAPPANAQLLPDSREEIQLSFAPLVQRSSPAVVNVYSERLIRQSRSPFANDPFFERFFGGNGFGMPEDRVQSSLGSGVIVGSEGIIVTNNHVVEDANALKVVLSDRREFEAELVLADERTDLAVLRINPEGEELPFLEFADTRLVQVGDLVLAIGNPFGVGQTVTSGIVSATARTDVGISDYAFFIQTDAAINPGNSGGALIDNAGKLVGVNTAIFSRSGGSNGIGFAIPAEMVKRVVDSAINEGRIVRPWLGLKGQAVTADIAKSLEVDRPGGVLVTEIYPDGPADNAKLRRGDVVLKFDGREVFDESGLKFLAATLGEGDTAPVSVYRNGETQVINLTVTAPPGATEAELTLLEGRNPLAGAEVADLSPALAESLRRDPFDEGVLINRIQRRSIAWRFGVRPGDLVVEVNGEAIQTVEDLEEALSSDDNDGIWQIAVDRNGRRLSETVRL
ncbi:MAG: serine protease [Ponticaulis sp.]|nr:serine protease [Ponticaulis sp.]|tara:strand:+ start:2549 stop:3988 length:1440 start_codon:yes stop_codon:yes gene_type:complete